MYKLDEDNIEDDDKLRDEIYRVIRLFIEDGSGVDRFIE